MPTAAPCDLQILHRGDGVRAIEASAMSRHGLDEDRLMARAGQGAWRWLLDRWPHARRIGVACGPGNNGGDGYVLAALARASGRDAFVLRSADAVKEGAARRAADAYAREGGGAAVFDGAAALPGADVWVDALFGTGLHRALDGAAAALVVALNAAGVPVLSLDVPSGVDADTGDDHRDDGGVAVRATLTLSFIAGKPGLYTGRGRAAAGEVVLDTLDLPPDVFVDVPPAACLLHAGALASWLPPRERDAHKGRFGHVLCVGGDHGAGGAIALCVDAAHRVGAGLVSAATRAAHVPVLLTRRPETMVHAVDDGDGLQRLLERASVLAIGPGLGRDAWGSGLLAAALAQRRPLVIDADGLNLLPAATATMGPGALPHAVLTPHPGEGARLLETTVAHAERDRIGSARALSRRFGAVVAWKGAGTVVAAPGAVPLIVDAGNPGMAAGGMGDVLTGVIAGLLAQGLSGADAAACGALLHACAADAAAAEGGERGLLPSDLLPHLRRLANPGASR